VDADSAGQEGTMKGMRTLLVLATLLAGATSETPAQPIEKIKLCHLNEVVEIGLLGTVISIPLPAWPAHERHFDYQTTVLNVGDLCGIIE
jgi:hypothetical protein